MNNARFFARVEREQVPAILILALALLMVFGILYGGASVLAPYVPWRVHVDFPFEANVPFVPEAAAIYLSIIPMLLLAPFVLRELRSLLPFVVALALETVVGFLGFMVLPVEPSAFDQSLAASDSRLYALADWMNLHGNYLPSLHVAFAVTAVLAYGEHARRFGKTLLICWALAIMASTLLIHQHYVLDVITGAVLAWLCWRVATAWARRMSALQAVDVELICLASYARFSRRHIRYFFIACTLLFKSVPHFRRRRLLRTGFAFLQSVDDLLDGDRRSEREPLEIADEMITALRRNEFPADELSRLGRAFRTDLVARGGIAALVQAIELIQTMAQDRVRLLGELLYDAETLQAHHRATFLNSLDLLLLASDAELRSSDVPELADALGWCSTVRDLKQDLAHRLVNIPREIVEEARRREPTLRLVDLANAPAVREWLSGEAVRVLLMLDRIDTRLAELAGRSGSDVLALFSRSIRRYAQRWSTSHQRHFGMRYPV